MSTQPKYASRIDKNQTELVQFFRSQGYSVKILSTVGEGFPDLILGKHNRNYLVEVKDIKGQLTPKQVDFLKAWRGQAIVIRSIDDAVAFINEVREQDGK